MLARIQGKSLNIRLPYINQGARAYNGRTLDERAVNPFFHENRIPSSRGPYLSTFRRSVRFDVGTRGGLRDKGEYDALLKLVSYLEATNDDRALFSFLDYLLFKFVKLRESSAVSLSRLQRISLDQYERLISGLLGTPSGGRFPVLLVVATFRTIKNFFNLDWAIEHQEINVADTAAGAGGDITIRRAGEVLMAAEVTERPVDRTRVVATFNTKIAPHGIEDYLFFVKVSGVSEDARRQAHQYFSQGHEVSFLEIKDWILMSVATVGAKGRAIFNRVLLELLDDPELPRSLKMAWNAQIEGIIGG